jgi:uncharacterized CHY-type Zn-finger protein
MNAGYSKYLRSHHWRALRAKAIKHYGRACFLCRFTDQIEVHHLTYRNVVDVTLDDLLVLCGACHSRVHTWMEMGLTNETVSNDLKRERLVVKFGMDSRWSKEDRKIEESRHLRSIPATPHHRRRAILTEAIEHGLNIRD